MNKQKIPKLNSAKLKKLKKKYYEEEEKGW